MKNTQCSPTKRTTTTNLSLKDSQKSLKYIAASRAHEVAKNIDPSVPGESWKKKKTNSKLQPNKKEGKQARTRPPVSQNTYNHI